MTDMGFIGDTSRARRELLDVELDLATSREERIAILEDSLKAFTFAEQQTEAMVNIGVRPVEGSYLAKADRIKAEIELHRAKRGP